ncbi:hypothetical protein EJB05_43817, partial [Eragrostis curvula]
MGKRRVRRMHRTYGLWNKEKAETDRLIYCDRLHLDEVVLCIHLVLLCVQENLIGRPAMPQVVHILENGSKYIMQPQIGLHILHKGIMNWSVQAALQYNKNLKIQSGNKQEKRE